MHAANQAISEQVAEALRAELLDGALAPGSHLSEEQLAERFGVGRYTVRSALRSLVTAGLLVHERHRGAFVPELSRARIDELFTYRSVVELGSLRLALERGHDLRPVERAVIELERVDPAGEAHRHVAWHEVTAAHRAVHHAIVAAAGNPRLVAAYAACEDELQFLLAFIRPEFRAGRLARLHRDLLNRLGSGIAGAQAALAADLEVGRQGLVRALDRSTLVRPTPHPRPVDGHSRPPLGTKKLEHPSVQGRSVR
ncbi:GntR family transcriptional regulator [Actinopolymorpha alba]|uniref:GntR family transcriptional regulator n=1 Tax=Actinopolymorpha alba TaxID=533267 RepID=UPI0003783439|nr:GntR family transcriptional regulator [Actinopolymorpha alba]